MRPLIWLGLLTTLLGCSPQPPGATDLTTPPPAAPAEGQTLAGICYDARGCLSGYETWYRITQSQCRATTAQSWQASGGACVNF